MGAATFYSRAKGKTALEAFQNATEKARYDHGHSGYTGTLAEKHSFVMIPVPADRNAREYADDLINDGDPRIDDKWGPAGCIELGEGEFAFFGWASS